MGWLLNGKSRNEKKFHSNRRNLLKRWHFSALNSMSVVTLSTMLFQSTTHQFGGVRTYMWQQTCGSYEAIMAVLLSTG